MDHKVVVSRYIWSVADILFYLFFSYSHGNSAPHTLCIPYSNYICQPEDVGAENTKNVFNDLTMTSIKGEGNWPLPYQLNVGLNE